MRPMLATKGTRPPAGAAWLHEVKWDGVRALVEASRDGAVRMTSRNENVITAAWPDVAEAGAARDLLLDGEVIALGERGTPDFRALQDRIHVRRREQALRWARERPAVLMVFDVLRLDGRDLAGRPLEERRAILEGLRGELGAWQVPDAHDDGAMLAEATLAQGLEGVVSKRRDSPYRFGERSPHWLKMPHRTRASYVVGGWRPQEGTHDRLAALLVGEPTPDGLAYRGRVGSGIGTTASARLRALLDPLAAASSPFADEVPALDARGTRWVRPLLVVEVETHGVGYRRLRQPSFQGVRTDVTAADL
ncbi:non-homologous end-joining DNA ligase [Nocardioides sp. TRM66260-LWL]|uniref:non-homologous end-joining DNA ligase n=1 Tax=Nocardioides sp. TRM66260-LWL TaxID=2874478 RepID=UPI001CC6C57A|nr:non-homologous end-joining DNA ligase [Nocardioides sp. TRM66260-LWL]MBZ5732885.1 non-homologous end-joining DNA ligase [Nocardioides sp. TRM66260-LWL]